MSISKVFSDLYNRLNSYTKSSRSNVSIVDGDFNKIISSHDHNTLYNMYSSNVIAFKCINLIARNVSNTDLVLSSAEGVFSQHPVLDLIANPSLGENKNSFLEKVVSYLLITGNAFIRIVKNSDGSPISLNVINPQNVSVERSRNNKKFKITFSHEDKIIHVNALSGISDMIHLKTFNPMNTDKGLSPLYTALSAAKLHNIILEHNITLLNNSLRPSGILMFHGELKPEVRKSIRSQWEKGYQGYHNTGQCIILEKEKCEWKDIGSATKDIDFTEGRNLAARDIAQALGVPPILIGIKGEQTFSNYKEAHYHLWEDTILPLIDKILSFLNTGLIPHFLNKGENKESLFLTYNKNKISALSLKKDEEWKRINNAEFLTINEKREHLGFSKIENADLIVESDFVIDTMKNTISKTRP